MPSVFTHAVAARALGTALLPRGSGPRTWLLGVVCAVLPDIDVVAFALGIPYSSMFGHRGLSHSISFALLLSALVTALAFRTSKWAGMRWRIWLFLFAATASHGVLDAFTNGGLGIAFFAPFSAARYFFPVTPIEVSPIVHGFFSERGIRILASEMMWVWAPALVLIALSIGVRRLHAPRAA
jgi:inner membrane protein